MSTQAASRLESLNNQIQSEESNQNQDPKKSLAEYRVRSQLCPKSVDLMMYGYNSSYRLRVFDIIKRSPEIFKHPHLEEWDREKYRYMSFRMLKQLDSEKNLDYEDYKKDPHITSIMGLALFQWNPSHCIKHGVHFYLYMKTIINLGSEKHEGDVKRAVSLDDIGSFALTELGHGSNVKAIQTTSTYDPATNEFILHTPSDMALKWWIGATAQLANRAVVWAQLIVHGENKGVHAFLIHLRDLKSHLPIDGVTIGDCGPKVGMDGIDNGFLKFTNYRIPYYSLLDKFSSIQNLKFETTIANAEKRFGLQLGSLSGGRISISIQSNSAAMIALTIATRYACIRKQFASPGQPESSIIEYPLVLHRLMVCMAQFAVSQVAALSINQTWDHNQQNVLDAKNTLINSLHAQSSVLKAQISWQSMRTVQTCREILGGHGYSSLNRLGMLYRDNDVNITWEGDNNVLLQQTAKFVLEGARTLMQGKESKHRTLDFLSISPPDEDDRWSATELSHFKDPNTILAALQWRVNLLLNRSGLRLQENMGKQSDAFSAWNATQVFYLNSLALAYGDVYQAQEFITALSKIEHTETKNFELWGLNVIVNDLGTFRDNNFVESKIAVLVKDRILELIQLLKDQTIGFFDIVSPPDEIIGSPFGAYDGDIYNKYLAHVRASKNCYGRVPWWQEIHS